MIQSFRVDIAPDADGHVFLVFDTVLESKHVFSACGLGRADRGETLLSHIAQATLSALTSYAEGEPNGRLHMVEIATVAAAPMRVRKALERADHKDIVFFVCRSPDIYDAAFFALNVDLSPGQQVQ